VRYRRSTVVTAIVAVLLIIVYLFPVYWELVTSLKTEAEVFRAIPSFWPEQITFKNYLRPFLEDVYIYFLRNSILVAIGSVALNIPPAILAAYAFSRYKIKHARDLFFWALTNRMGPAAAFIIPYYAVYSTLGLIDTIWGLIIAYSIFNLPFAIWLLKGFIDGLPRELEDSARVDGCSELQVLRRVVLPVLKPGIGVSSLFTFIFSWNEYLFASILTVTYNSRTLPSGLFGFVTVAGIKWAEMAATSLVASIPPLIFIYFMQRYMVAGLTFGAVKG